MTMAALARPVAGPLAAPSERADAYRAAARSERTRAVYGAAWVRFVAWCDGVPCDAFPASPETVARYAAALADAGRRPRTIGVAMAAIRAEHFDGARFDPTSHPTVRAVLAGIRRTMGTAPSRKAALPVAQLSAMCSAIPDDARGHRDRAVLLLGFAGAFRRAALVALDIENLESCDAGIRVTIRRDKTDQESAGRTIIIPFGDHDHTCPVRAIQAWFAVRGADSGPLFISFRGSRKGPRMTDRRLGARAVAEIVKARAEAVGIDPSGLAGHSLRAGLATAAAKGRKRLDMIMAQTGHAKTETLMGYVRDAELGGDENAAKGIGL